MAKQVGIFKVKGTIQDISFYKSKDGYLVRSKGGVDGARIATDAAYELTRQNNKEFGNAAKAGKVIRNTMRSLMANAKDGRVTSRLTQIMTLIKNMDTTSERGNRTVAGGYITPTAKALLKNFDFNINAELGSVLFSPFTTDHTNYKIEFASLVPVNDIAYPNGATHVTLKAGFAFLDFQLGTGSIYYSNAVNKPIDAQTSIVSLSATPAPVSVPGDKLFLLMVQFFQEVNGVQYPMKNGNYNALSIVDVE